jgi:shikimate kinase
MENVYLVGFMGTGKSAVGKAIAKKKHLRFIDLDNAIEKKEKRLINDIFAQEGEPYFRILEKNALKEAAKGRNLVVACGGGIVLAPENIRAMKKTGKIICLAALPEAIVERTRRSRHRPLLNVADPEKKIKELLKTRAPFYSLADITIDTASLSVKEVADKIIQLIDTP